MAEEQFWQSTPLESLTEDQWESLCDGCGRCCLIKLEDEDSGEIAFTRVSCRLLDIENCRCSHYKQRRLLEPACLQVREMRREDYHWLPETCAYRCVAEGRPLADWHPLVSGNPDSVHEAGISVVAFAVSESHVHPDELEQLIIVLEH